jgi:hypothetical protein
MISNNKEILISKLNRKKEKNTKYFKLSITFLIIDFILSFVFETIDIIYSEILSSSVHIFLYILKVRNT